MIHYLKSTFHGPGLVKVISAVMDVVFGTSIVRANKLLFIVISNVLKNAIIVAEIRHGIARSFKVYSTNRACLSQAIASNSVFLFFFLSDVILSQRDI